MSETAAEPLSEPPAYRVPALEKGLDVIELLAGAPGPFGLTDLAERLDRTKQELFRVVNCLHGRGYLVRDRAGRYRISTRLFELGSKQAPAQTLVARAMPHMERLATRLEESCHLNIVADRRMLVVAQARSQSDIALAVRVGATFSLHERNTGRVALAFMTQEERRAYWAHCGEPAETIARWETELDAIRRRGFDVAGSVITVGITDCATPILGAGGTLLGVLCVSHIVRVGEQADRSPIPNEVVACARAISREFGPGPLDENND